MNVFTRIERLERLLHRPVRGIKYTMPDGSWRILPYDHIGFSEAIQGINSPAARIVLNAVTDSNNNNGKMLQLLHATMHPVDTETVQDENISVIVQS